LSSGGRSRSRSSRPRAVVIGLDSITGLQVARILAGRGVPVIGIAADRRHFACRTRVCESIHYADIAGDGLIRTLDAVGQSLEQKAVLVPCTDPIVLTLSRNRSRLEPWYHLVLPDHDVVEKLMDKIGFATYAQEQGLPIPQTFFLRNRTDAEAAAGALNFPAALKPPLKTAVWEQEVRAKAIKVAGPEELLAEYDRTSPYADVLLAQDWIEGGEGNLFSCNAYFDRDAKPLATFVARKIRQWPPQTGISSLGEECRNDEVLRETLRLFEGVGFRGLCYLEMKRDERTGRHFIVEPNVGRPTGRSPIAEAGGVELHYAAYCDAAGLPLPAALEQRYGDAKWIYFRFDLQSALHYWRHGELSLRDWKRSWQGRKVDAVFSRRDPVPFALDFWGTARKGARLLLASRRQGRIATAPERADAPKATSSP
jgi:D-aspartate ligase